MADHGGWQRWGGVCENIQHSIESEQCLKSEQTLGCARFAEIFMFSSGASTNLSSTRQELHDITMKGLCEMCTRQQNFSKTSTPQLRP